MRAARLASIAALVAVLAQAWPIAQRAALPRWTPGTLDIHQISTGRGNAALIVLPDGTTMLVDAGAAGDGAAIPATEPRPNAAKTAGGWIAAYISRVLGPTARLDYAVITHYHADHMGQVTPASETTASGAYKLTGITEVGDHIPIDTLIDRGDGYLPPGPKDQTFANYHAFVDAQSAARGLKRERARVGDPRQIVAKRGAGGTPFEVRPVAANGEVWTGREAGTRTVFPPLDGLAEADRPTENNCSVALLVRYGRFSFFTGGDTTGQDPGAPEYQLLERPIADAIGHVDVHVVNHHGSIEPESPYFLATLGSRVLILPSWSPTHPSADVLKRMLSTKIYPAPRDVFATVMREPTKLAIGARAGQLKADHGHIVVRVEPGGASYRVFVLDDTKEDAPMIGEFGPYAAGASR